MQSLTCHNLDGCQADDVQWANWPLPVTSSGELADIGIYARDVARFGRKFIELAGLRRAEPRALPGQAHASQLRSLEERQGVGKGLGRFCSMFC